MSNGKDYKLFISTAGTAVTPLVELEFQGDLTINTGKSVERTPFKNGAITAQGENGFSFNVQMGLREPMPAAQTKIWEHSDSGDAIYAVIKGATGTLQFAGTFKLAITELPNPVNGIRVATVEFSQDGTVTRGTAT